MSWYLEEKDQQIFVNRCDGQVHEISNIRAASYGKLEVSLKSKENPVVLALADFKADRSVFSSHFKDVINSRTAFLAQWRKLNVGHIQATEIEKKTVNGVIETVLKDKFIGTHDVHISNLKPPASCRATRDVNHSHVGELEDSFRNQDFEQIVILVGMICNNVVPEDFRKPGSVDVEVLGGNHTRLALQSLLEKGLLHSPYVKVNLYQPLPRTEALTLGYQHNFLLEEKKKPMSFVEKVKLMRECRPSANMSSSQISSWKEMLCIIFRVDCKRKLQQRMSQHLQMARIQEDVFKKVVQASEKKHVNEKFFKPMLRLNDDNLYHTCLDVLIADGENSFKKKVAEFIGQGAVRSKRAADVIDVPGIEVDVFDGDDKKNEEIVELKEMISTLEEEKEELKRELDGLREKKERDDDYKNEEEKWTVGERIRAKWHDNEYYLAEIQKVETVYHVIFTDDNKRRKVHIQDLMKQ